MAAVSGRVHLKHVKKTAAPSVFNCCAIGVVAFHRGIGMNSTSKVGMALLAGLVIGSGAVQALHAQAKLPAYAVIEAEVSNTDGYIKEYVPLASKALTEQGGGFLVRGGKVIAIDGAPPKQRLIVLRFESLERAQAAFASAAYRDARKTGDKFAKFNIWAVEGVAK